MTAPQGYNGPQGYGPQQGYGPPPGYGPQQGYGPPPGHGAPQYYGAPQYAGWGSRVGAYLIDIIIIGVPFAILNTIGGAIDGGAGGFVTFLGVLWYLGALVYNRWVLGGKSGQTWGRQVLKIRLVGEATGQPIGVGMAFVRDIAHFVDSVICYIGWLFPLWDAKKQTIADKIVKTLVVQA